MEHFLPDDYESPKSESRYLRFEQGENRFRALSSAITGFVYFNNDNKPNRSREYPHVVKDIKKDGKVKHFWAFVVWNYRDEKVQILELTQKTLMTYIKTLADNPKWGTPKGYDLVVNREGEGLDTEYTITAEPHSETPKMALEELKNTPVDLTKLYEGGDPFEVK